MNGEELAKALRYREEEAAGGGHSRPGISPFGVSRTVSTTTRCGIFWAIERPLRASFPPKISSTASRTSTRRRALSPLLVEAYGTAAERLARNAFRPGSDQRPRHLQAVRGVPRQVHPELWTEGISPSARIPPN